MIDCTCESGDLDRLTGRPTFMAGALRIPRGDRVYGHRARLTAPAGSNPAVSPQPNRTGIHKPSGRKKTVAGFSPLVARACSIRSRETIQTRALCIPGRPMGKDCLKKQGPGGPGGL
jgi:hypothetical protein